MRHIQVGAGLWKIRKTPCAVRGFSATPRVNNCIHFSVHSRGISTLHTHRQQPGRNSSAWAGKIPQNLNKGYLGGGTTRAERGQAQQQHRNEQFRAGKGSQGLSPAGASRGRGCTARSEGDEEKQMRCSEKAELIYRPRADRIGAQYRGPQAGEEQPRSPRRDGTGGDRGGTAVAAPGRAVGQGSHSGSSGLGICSQPRHSLESHAAPSQWDPPKSSGTMGKAGMQQ